MKRLLAAITVVAVAWAGLSSARAAPPPPCLDMGQRLQLLPLSASYNGAQGQPTGAGSGAYATDAGVQFFVAPVGELTAVRVEDSTACPRPVDQVTISVADPWTGERFSLSVKGTP